MGRDEGAGGNPSDLPAGPRRSTFTPPPADAVHQFMAEGQAQAVPIDAPPPLPSTVVTPPPGSALPRPPQRSSLPDQELLSTLGDSASREGGALGAIEQLQRQLRIREQEAREFRNWESSMRAIGTPEALNTVEEVRTTFTEAIQMIPLFDTTETVLPAAPVAPQATVPADLPDPEPIVYELVEPELSARTSGSIQIPPGFAQQDDPVTVENAGSLGGPDSHEGPDPSEGSEPTVGPESRETAVESAAEESIGGQEYTGGEIVIERAPPAPTPGPETAQVPPQHTFIPETAGPEPTEPVHRTGRAIRLFWLWFAANSSVLSLVLGAVLLGMGMSLRQAILAALAGIAISFLPIGLATLAAKWNGQPTVVVSRASFGRIGNLLPTVLAVVTRLLWGTALLWLLAVMGAELLSRSGAGASLSTAQLAIIVAGAGFLLAAVVAFFGFRLILWTQLVLSVASAGLIVTLIGITWPLVDMTNALSIADGPWLLVLSGAIIVFSYIGLIWASGAGDVARYQRRAGSGAGSMLTASFGSALPPLVLIGYGALLAASDPELALALVSDPAGALASTVPSWFLIPLLAAVGVGLLSGVILAMYSGGFAVQALGLRMRRDVAVLVVSAVTGIGAIALTAAHLDLDALFRDLATTLAVPTAAWLGIFAGEMMIRNRGFDTASLLRPGGVYPRTRWVNLVMLVVATGVGYGLTTASVSWLSWQGYLNPVFGIPDGSELAGSDIGVLVALAIAFLTPLIAGVPAIREQERVLAENDDSTATSPVG